MNTHAESLQAGERRDRDGDARPVDRHSEGRGDELSPGNQPQRADDDGEDAETPDFMSDVGLPIVAGFGLLLLALAAAVAAAIVHAVTGP